MDTFIFSGLLWPPQPRRSDGKPQILMWILMWKKGKNLVYLYVKLSILSIGGPRLIFMNSNKCPTMWLIKKWDVALSSRFVWRYSFSQLSIRTLEYLGVTVKIRMESLHNTASVKKFEYLRPFWENWKKHVLLWISFLWNRKWKVFLLFNFKFLTAICCIET